MLPNRTLSSLRIACLLGFVLSSLGMATPVASSAQPKSNTTRHGESSDSLKSSDKGASRVPGTKLALNQKVQTTVTPKRPNTPNVDKKTQGGPKLKASQQKLKSPPRTTKDPKISKARSALSAKKNPVSKPPQRSNQIGTRPAKEKAAVGQKPIKASTVQANKIKGSKNLLKPKKEISKANKSPTKSKSGSPRGAAPPDSAPIASEEDESDLLSIGLATAVLAIGIGGLFWYRNRQNRAKKVESIDFHGSDMPVSTFVSNVTAFDLDSNSDTDSGVEKRGKEAKAKLSRFRTSDAPSLTQADQDMIEGTPLATTQGTRQITSTNPPASGSPAQIVVPKKSKTPAAS